MAAALALGTLLIVILCFEVVKRIYRSPRAKTSGPDVGRRGNGAVNLGEGTVKSPAPAETFEVIWQGEVVGALSETRNDMGYLEGRFATASSTAGARFTQRASLLDGRAAISDNSLGARAAIVSSLNPTSRRMTVVVLSLDQGNLAVYLPFRKEAIAWIEANVPE